MASSVQLKALCKQFAGAPRPAVSDLSLTVKAGEVISLVGPSGCGKSTTLRMIAGLEQPDSGSISIGEKSVLGKEPQARDVAMVFQGFALYPHLRVADIMAFPLKMRKVPKAERERSVRQAAQMLNITPLLARYPAELSGGEQQRVAMGRAIVRSPEVFLFDEPLSNLDAALRSELRVELRKLLSRLDATALYVTHDQVEAMTLSDRICVLNKGKLEQVASPREIYESPTSTFVAGFFGSPPMNLLKVAQAGDTIRVGSLRAPKPAAADGPLIMGFRPEAVRLASSSTPSDALVSGEADVTAVEPLGAETNLELSIDGQRFRVKVPGFDAPSTGATVNFEIPVERLKWFHERSGQAL